MRGFRRVLGTVIGIAAGLLIAVPLHGAPAPTAALVAVCVFGIFYTAAPSYSWMMFFVTVMAGLLYGLLGVLHPGLLLLRFQETAIGALGAALAVVIVLPVTTHAANDAWIQRALHCVRASTAATLDRLMRRPGRRSGPARRRARTAAGPRAHGPRPLVHPLSPLRARKARARQVLALLDDCAREVRGLVAVAADPQASHDARLAAACWRVQAAVEALTAPHGAAELTAPAAPRPAAAAESALAHLHGLEHALVALATPLRTHPRAPLIPAA